MIKKHLALLLTCFLLAPALYADKVSDQEYINKLKYQRNKLELVTKKRKIDETRRYSYTDIDTYTFSYEAYSHTTTDIDTEDVARRETKEITEWYIYKGGLRQLSDLEFLRLIGNRAEFDRIAEIEKKNAGMRGWGNIVIGTGLVVMIGGAAMSAGSATITAGALGMTAGFFINAFNSSPAHYITPDYAQEKIDEHNIALKKKLGLPIDFD